MFIDKKIILLLSSFSLTIGASAIKFYYDYKINELAISQLNEKINQLSIANELLQQDKMRMIINSDITNAKIDTVMSGVNSNTFNLFNNTTITIMCVIAVGALVVTAMYFTPSSSSIDKIVKDAAINNIEANSHIHDAGLLNLSSSLSKLSKENYDSIIKSQSDSKIEILSAIKNLDRYIKDLVSKIVILKPDNTNMDLSNLSTEDVNDLYTVTDGVYDKLIDISSAVCDISSISPPL